MGVSMVNPKHEILNPKQFQMFKMQNKGPWGKGFYSMDVSPLSVWDICASDFVFVSYFGFSI
jgi:hypothetical protein